MKYIEMLLTNADLILYNKCKKIFREVLVMQILFEIVVGIALCIFGVAADILSSCESPKWIKFRTVLGVVLLFVLTVSMTALGILYFGKNDIRLGLMCIGVVIWLDVAAIVAAVKDFKKHNKT